jgi:hypothetical protein
MIKYLERVENRYVETTRRPPKAIARQLDRELAENRRSNLTHKHTPGDGWHYLPTQGEATYCYNGAYWFVNMDTSEEAILAAVSYLCAEADLDFTAIQQEAYPEETPYLPTEADLNQLARPVNKDDWPALLDDLTDVNYHSLRSALEDHLARTGANLAPGYMVFIPDQLSTATVVKVRLDDDGEPLIDVVLPDGSPFICRPCELERSIT